MPRRFALGSAARAICLPDVETAPTDLKAGLALHLPRVAEPAIHLPADHYAHPGAPTEWWWNVGTLRAGERIFGFEINAVSYAGQGGFAFTQVMLTDVSNQRHLQRTTYYQPGVFNCENWAEHDPLKNWFVALGSPSNHLSGIDVVDHGKGYTPASPPTVEITGGGGKKASATVNLSASGAVASIDLWSAGEGYTSEPTVTLADGAGSGATAKAFHSYVTMSSMAGDPTQNMTVKSRLVDEKTGAVVTFDLLLSQQGPPFLVLGRGLIPVPLTCGSHLQKNNYYYSLTRLQASGTISLDGETFDVTGVTWMDHEYGAFAAAGKPVHWILQDMQLDNGVSISSFTLFEPEPNKDTVGIATVQHRDGRTTVALSIIKPKKPWVSPVTGKTYFMELHVELVGDPTASLTVTSLIESQEFPVPGGAIYEGVAQVSGVFNGHKVSGTAWNEQAPR